ncbi:thermonuclease family protein [Desulfocurvibacter africanus]|uniref:Nuclease (SNase domain-containing protein) n=1 Tax=Desulfocurvibacter africanus subsp. africanus str. Walvis Bay TaxID=690850 RepID=F3Z2U7_DESAF|nr:thermonuclease family protein [Desulfocurvibacter africanus]EGJ50264.1 nuclease (SNase domain-containing protein) [Desulfocurvibacter africanus subsp. africanus str. Walvis Bay]
MRYIITIFLLLWPVLAFGFPAKVIKISDGDTLTVLTEDKRQVRVRLFGVDTPEKKQAFGSKATDFTKSIAALQMVDVQEMDVDRYGRLVGKVTLADGRVLNAELVANGWAWVYRDYCRTAECTAWEQLEAQARQKRIGLWQDKNPQAPWEWRRSQKGGGQPDKPAKAKKEPATSYRGNTSSHVFHTPGCKFYDCANCTETFASREEALKAGFKPCGVCKP